MNTIDASKGATLEDGGEEGHCGWCVRPEGAACSAGG
jgi:hypothetical protein